jgi:hypothetical protein
MSTVLTLEMIRLTTWAVPKNEHRTHTANDQAYDTGRAKNEHPTHTGNDEAFDTGRAFNYSSVSLNFSTTLRMIVHEETHFLQFLN